MATINIEMSEHQAGEIINEAKNEATEVAFRLANHHLQYESGARNHDIDAEEIKETVKRLDTIGELIEMLEDARTEAWEGEE